MARKITSHGHRVLVGKLLREARKAAGLQQASLAKKLGKPHSFVSRYETGERRLDILELQLVCAGCETTLLNFVKQLIKALKSA
jgi:transcriptional regulator with XRE-family HTH domain